MVIPSELQAIAEDVGKGQQRRTSPRLLIAWFGAHRRGYWVVKRVREALSELGLVTSPDFEYAWIDENIDIVPAAASAGEGPTPSSGPAAPNSGPGNQESPRTPEAGAPPPNEAQAAPSSDPTYRIGKLEAANRPPVYVTPDDTVIKAITQMMTNDFSQIPVMQNERAVKGLISWESIAQTSLLGKPCTRASDCMTPAHEISSDTSLFDAIGGIVFHGYALIRARDQKISGIVTATDLGVQLGRLGEPFLLLGEIENYLRRAIEGRFSIDQLRAVKDPSDPRVVNSVEDLTFGEYIRLLESPANWGLLKLALDRGEFTKGLNDIREIRNDVMHFDPDGPSEEDLATLRRWGALFQRLSTLRVL